MPNTKNEQILHDEVTWAFDQAMRKLPSLDWTDRQDVRAVVLDAIWAGVAVGKNDEKRIHGGSVACLPSSGKPLVEPPQNKEANDGHDS